jgi:eukaryotic translation initiation factor 2-alpha kinase 4
VHVQVKKDLLLGHLLALAMEGNGVGLPRHALPALASNLVAQGLLPRWTAQTMTQHPKLFDRAFQRVFAAEQKLPALPDPVGPRPLISFP